MLNINFSIYRNMNIVPVDFMHPNFLADEVVIDNRLHKVLQL